jgi:hypothetical protein
MKLSLQNWEINIFPQSSLELGMFGLLGRHFQECHEQYRQQQLKNSTVEQVLQAFTINVVYYKVQKDHGI